METEASEVEKRVEGEAYEELRLIQRKLMVVEALAKVQRLEREVGGLCPLHGNAKLSLWDVKLSCGHSLEEVAELLQEAAGRVERKLREGE